MQFLVTLEFNVTYISQEKPIVAQPQSNGLKSHDSTIEDHLRVANGHHDPTPDDYEKEERRRAAQRVLGKQG